MINFEKTKTCAFTGHRELENDFNEQTLENVVLGVIERGYSTFMVGMALGFDTQTFHTLEKLRKIHKIKIIACIPCSEQADKFSKTDSDEYFRMLSSCDEQVLVSVSYFAGCMQKRNKFMVDNSSLLVSYLRKNKGGTFSTVKYAMQKGVEIISI